MTRMIFALALPLLALSACNVEREGNATTISVDENTLDAAADQAGNALEGAAGEVKDAAQQAAPVLENAAEDVGNAVETAGDRIEQGADRAATETREETREATGNR